MGLIQHLAEIYEQSRIEYEQQKSGAFRLIERLEAGNGEKVYFSGKRWDYLVRK